MEEKFRFARNLRQVMNEKDWKPRDLKRALANSGVKIADPTLSNYLSENEGNVRTPKLGGILDFARACGVHSHKLLGKDFAEHDSAMDDMTRCGEVFYSKSLGLGENVEMFTVKDNSTEGFSSGDRLVVDKNDRDVTAGFYVAVIGHISQLVSIVNDGKEYTVTISKHAARMSYEDVRIVGKVVGRFTTQI